MIATTVLCLTVIMVVDQTQLGNNYLAPVCCCIPVTMECSRNVLSKPSFLLWVDLSWVCCHSQLHFFFYFLTGYTASKRKYSKIWTKAHCLLEPMSYDIIFIRVAVMPKFKGRLAHLSIIGEAM